MAPPRGGHRGQSAQTSRGPGSTSSLSSKASARGGIQKRRGGGPARVDTDGDLDMDVAGGPRRNPNNNPPTEEGRSSRNTRASRATAASRGPSRAAQAIAKHLNGPGASLGSRISMGTERRATRGSGLTWLKVRGLKESKAANNEGGGLKDLLSFLERKAAGMTKDQSRRIMIRKSEMSGDYVLVGVTAEDAEEILKVNSFTFAGATLEISLDESRGPPANKQPQASSATQETKERLQGVLGERYDGATKLLRLNALAQDPTLVSMGMFESKERAEKTFRALMKICDDLFKTLKEKREAIESISLADNNIDDVVQVDSVAETFPHLKNLDLSGNRITSMEGLSRWRGKFRYLETLFMARNPVTMTDANYTTALLTMFPKLQFLDGVQARTPQQIAETEAASRPKPLPQHGPDFRDANGIGERFLLEFFHLYDTNRQGLVAKYYDEGSQFSLAVDTNSVRDPNAPPPLPWAAYIKFSRNFLKITHENARIQRLLRGGNVIYDLWKDLPLTRHPDIKANTNKYIMDCHILPGLLDPSGRSPTGIDGMVISCHGEFDEQDQTGKSGKRSFSRVFVLGPGIPGRNEIRVISDMLSLRANSPLPDIFAAPQTQAPAPNQEQDQKQVMVAELSKQTGMTPTYSEMCLSQVNWDFNKALVVFNEKKAVLPPEAFAAAPAMTKGSWQ